MSRVAGELSRVANPNPRRATIRFLTLILTLELQRVTIYPQPATVRFSRSQARMVYANISLFPVMMQCLDILECYFPFSVVPQLYLLLFSVRWRMLLARSSFAFLLLFIYFLRSLRNIWQIAFHLTVAVFVLYQTTKRQLQEKPPDYNV